MSTKAKSIKATKTRKATDKVLVPALSIVSGGSQAFILTDSGIQIRQDLTFEEWREGLKLFRWAQINLNIGFADYIKFGELKFGADKTGAAIAQLEFPLSEITKAININTVPASIRKLGLDADQLVVLGRAKLTVKQLEKWAKVAVTKNLGASQLKESIKMGEVVSKQVADKNNHGIITIHGLRQEAEIWLRRMGGLEGIAALDHEERTEIRGELTLFVSIFDATTLEK